MKPDLLVDGMLSETGLRDAVEGGYVDREAIGISAELWPLRQAGELFPYSAGVGALLGQAQAEAQDHCPDVLNGPPQCVGYGFDFHPARNSAPQIVDVGLSPALMLAGHNGVPASAPSAGTRVASSHLHRSPSPEDGDIPARPGSTFTEHGSAGA